MRGLVIFGCSTDEILAIYYLLPEKERQMELMLKMATNPRMTSQEILHEVHLMQRKRLNEQQNSAVASCDCGVDTEPNSQ